MSRQDYNFFTEIPTRWGDADMLGHINNVIFVRYLETARLDYLSQIAGVNFQVPIEEGVILADIQLTFLRQAHHPAVFDVATRVSRLGNSSLDVQAEIFLKDQDQPVVKSTSVCVWFDYANNIKAAIPQSLRNQFITYERVKPL